MYFNFIKQFSPCNLFFVFNYVTCYIMKTEASKDKGQAADGNRQRSGRLYVNRALNHMRII